MKSQYFSRHEFRCRCGCGKNTVDTELLEVLEDLRAFFERPVVPNSGHRCEQYNKEVGGGEKSQHLEGKAADIVVVGVSPYEVYDYLNHKYPNQYGIGQYPDFTHIDVRTHEVARW
ncbi:MAG: D-Ala-D-Ala carboxypeptidase family metallohydrolase [Candidatus Thiodiazotropha sp.]